MNETDPARIGRPPGPHGDTLDKVLPVALRVFLEEGGAALTPTRLHAETGIARATIYRNWPEAADLVEIMLERATEHPESVSFTGDLRTDLHTATDLLLDRFHRRPARAFFSACIEYGRHSDRVARAAEAFIGGILAPFRDVIAEAADRGEIDGDVDELTAEITGPLILEHVVMGKRISDARARRLVDRVIDRWVSATG